MNPPKRYKRADYADYTRPRRHSVDGMKPQEHPAPSARAIAPVKSRQNSETILSVRINLPDYDRWQVVIFARHYPYISIAVAVLALIALGLLVTAVTAWV